ncbi:MAG: hypothetical protein QGD94_12195, partial [Planctomycetia bacterium]|nr:hypothetical protein [Planctomycetia bacterium]
QDKPGESAMSERLVIWCREKPGKGGVDRGRGDAPMTWSEGTSEEGAEFKEQTLSTSAMAALKDSKLRGVSAAAPTVRKAGAPKRGGALRGVTAGGGEAHTRTVLPRHKGTVERYFQRD